MKIKKMLLVMGLLFTSLITVAHTNLWKCNTGGQSYWVAENGNQGAMTLFVQLVDANNVAIVGPGAYSATLNVGSTGIIFYSVPMPNPLIPVRVWAEWSNGIAHLDYSGIGICNPLPLKSITADCSVNSGDIVTSFTVTGVQNIKAYKIYVSYDNGKTWVWRWREPAIDNKQNYIVNFKK